MTCHRRFLALGLIVASALVLAACSGSIQGTLDGSGRGQIRIIVSSDWTSADAAAGGGLTTQSLAAGAARLGALPSPACEHPDLLLQEANVTFASILARTLDGELIDVTIPLPVTVDVMALANGNDATLPIGLLPPGTYDQIVVVMTGLELVLTDGTRIAVTPPGGGWTAIIGVEEPFTVTEGATTTVRIRFHRELSFGCAGDDWDFHPRFDCAREGEEDR